MARGTHAKTAGLIAICQQPQTARGVTFMSLEDESGVLDIVVKPETWVRRRPLLKQALLIAVEGEVQRSGLAVSLLVHAATPLAAPLDGDEGAQATPQVRRKVQRSLSQAGTTDSGP